MTAYVLDASVAVAAVRPQEASHVAASKRLAAVLAGADDIVVPAIFDAEVTSALVRGGARADSALRYVERDLVARRIVTIGPRAARAISAVAARTRLRAADAAYVWVASVRNLPLVTLDLEIGRRAGALCTVQTP